LEDTRKGRAQQSFAIPERGKLQGIRVVEIILKREETLVEILRSAGWHIFYMLT
jgi:hypothetical protein